jgi:hypothetical protein
MMIDTCWRGKAGLEVAQRMQLKVAFVTSKGSWRDGVINKVDPVTESPC